MCAAVLLLLLLPVLLIVAVVVKVTSRGEVIFRAAPDWDGRAPVRHLQVPDDDCRSRRIVRLGRMSSGMTRASPLSVGSFGARASTSYRSS